MTPALIRSHRSTYRLALDPTAMPIFNRHSIRVLALAVAIAGCSDRGSTDAGSGGTLVISTAADADFLLPPLVDGVSARQVTDLLFDHLAEIGNELNTLGDAGFRPRLAERWEWSADSLTIAFHLDPDARWHDGRPVRAADVAFTHDFYSDPSVGSPTAPLIRNIDSVSVRDSLTAVVHFATRMPEQFFNVAYQLHILPSHVLGNVDRSQVRSAPIVRNPIGSGRFRFARWVPGQVLELVADTANYRGRPSLDRVLWSIAPDPSAATTRLFAGEADLYEVMNPASIQELKKHDHLKLVPYPSLAYGFLLFNMRDPKRPTRPHPVLGDVGTRRALSMAVDRERMVRNVFDSLATVGLGPFALAMSTADTTIRQIPYDTAGARRLLDSLGWRDRNGDGVRERNGQPLEISILVPSSSRPRNSFAVLIQEQLAQVGARVEIEPLEFVPFLERQRNKQFDAAVVALSSDPSPSGIRQHWGTPGPGEASGTNGGSYSNPLVDALIDSALTTRDFAAEKAYFKRAYQAVVDDAPAIWLYNPRLAAGMHRRIQPAGLRADGWHANLADWTIPTDQRIDRDRIGLRSALAPAADSAAGDSAGR